MSYWLFMLKLEIHLRDHSAEINQYAFDFTVLPKLCKKEHKLDSNQDSLMDIT